MRCRNIQCVVIFVMTMRESKIFTVSLSLSQDIPDLSVLTDCLPWCHCVKRQIIDPFPTSVSWGTHQHSSSLKESGNV